MRKCQRSATGFWATSFGVVVFLTSTSAVAQRSYQRHNAEAYISPSTGYHYASGSSYSRNTQRGSYSNRNILRGAGNYSHFYSTGNRNYYSGRSSRSYYGLSTGWPSSSRIQIGVSLPLGSRVRNLSPGYTSFGLGSHRYYYNNFNYYMHDTRAREYVVVRDPRERHESANPSTQSEIGELFVCPNRGQTDEQREHDRFECFQWAVEQTSYDPSVSNSDPNKGQDHRRASAACLEGRGHTVR